MAPHFTSGKFQTVQSPPMAKITSAALVLTGRLLLVVPQPPASMEIAIVANLGALAKAERVLRQRELLQEIK